MQLYLEQKTQATREGEKPVDWFDTQRPCRIVILNIKSLTVLVYVICKHVVDGRCDVQTEPPKGYGKRYARIGRKGKSVIQL